MHLLAGQGCHPTTVHWEWGCTYQVMCIFEECCARSGYQGQGQVITSHIYYLWNVIISPYPWYLLLVQYSSLLVHRQWYAGASFVNGDLCKLALRLVHGLVITCISNCDVIILIHAVTSMAVYISHRNKSWVSIYIPENIMDIVNHACHNKS